MLAMLRGHCLSLGWMPMGIWDICFPFGLLPFGFDNLSAPLDWELSAYGSSWLDFSGCLLNWKPALPWSLTETPVFRGQGTK